MNRQDLLFSLRAALASPRAEDFPVVARSTHPADVAAVLDDLAPREAWRLLRTLPPEPRAELFGNLSVEGQADVAAEVDRRDLAELFLHLAPDDRADLFNRLPEDRRASVLPALAQVEREDIRRLSSYPEGSVGAIMTSDDATVPPLLDAREAVEHLRSVAPDKATIDQAFVIDDERHIVGTVSLREVIAVAADAAREDAARLISGYDLIALPVIDGGERLVGIVTYDDAMDVAETEATEASGGYCSSSDASSRARASPTSRIRSRPTCWARRWRSRCRSWGSGAAVRRSHCSSC